MYRIKNENKIRAISAVITIILLPSLFFLIKDQTPFNFLQEVPKSIERWVTIVKPLPKPELKDRHAELLGKLQRMKEKLLRAKQDFNKRLNQSQRELTRPESQLNIDRTSDFSERFMNHKADKFSSRNRRLSENKENGIADIKSDDLVDFDYRKKTGTAEYGTFSGELAGMSAENKPSINSAIINWSSVDIDFDKDITNEYIELLEWIKNHPIELPHVFLNQMGGERKDPQTIVKYKEADIYMLVNESSMLLNIAVVYGDSIGILMDHGLSKDVRRLVKGEVIRMNDSETIRGIVANPTQTKKSLYEPLYRVFLSWWETAK